MHTSEPLSVEVKVEDQVLCAVCPHPWNDHDALGVRYCTATTAAGVLRGCICR